MVHCLEEKKIKEGFFSDCSKDHLRRDSNRYCYQHFLPSKRIMSTVLLSKKHVGIILLEDKKISCING